MTIGGMAAVDALTATSSRHVGVQNSLASIACEGFALVAFRD